MFIVDDPCTVQSEYDLMPINKGMVGDQRERRGVPNTDGYVALCSYVPSIRGVRDAEYLAGVTQRTFDNIAGGCVPDENGAIAGARRDRTAVRRIQDRIDPRRMTFEQLPNLHP